MPTDAANTIAESLKETDELPRKQIAEIIEVLGADTALALLAETRRVQEEGGIAVRDGTRRRTDGGVFFSLAKAKLPKPDRNRIFRVRPPRAPGAEEAPPRVEAPKPAPRPRLPEIEVRRPRPGGAPVALPSRPAASEPSVARRTVEVEFRHTTAAFPGPVEREEARHSAATAREVQPSPEPQRLVRRIVTVAPAVKEEAPPTPEAARGKIRELLKTLPVGAQRELLAELSREVGSEVAPRRAAPSEAPASRGGDEPLRERVLSAVTDALGLSAADLAQVLYGDDSPGARAKARAVMKRWRDVTDG